MEIVSGVAGIEYSHFYISEQIAPGFEDDSQVPDFRTDEPVLLTPGQLTIVSCVQSHAAWVTLMLSDEEPVQQTDEWQRLGTWPYAPIYEGRMCISGPTTGPASPAMDWLPGRGADLLLTLDPASVYTAHVYARGRQESRARFEAAMEREEWGMHEGFEDYVVVFIRAGQQTKPRPTRNDEI